MEENQYGIRAIHGVTKFNGRDDFHIWKFCMLRHLGRVGLMSFVKDAKPSSFSSQDKKEDWEKKNVATESMLLQAIEDSVIEMLTDCTSAKGMWDKLVTTHENSGVDNILRLQTELNSIWKDSGKSMADYIKELRGIFSKLNGVGKGLDDASKLVKLLAGLPMEEYEAIRTNLAFQSGMTFETACIKLETHEKDCLQSRSMGQGELNFTRKGGKKSSGKGAKDKSKVTCYNCKKLGHYANECKKKGEQKSSPYDKKGSQIKCFKCGEMGHKKSECKQDGQSGNTQAVNFMIEEKCESNLISSSFPEWIIDSGATHHMCNNPSLLERSWKPMKGKTILFGDGREVAVTMEGVARIQICAPNGSVKSAEIQNVLVIPNLSRNLISVTQSMKQGIGFIFDAVMGVCNIKKNGSVIGVAYLTDGLWKLKVDKSDFTSRVMLGSLKNSMELWHLRLGHLGEDNLKILVKNAMVEGIGSSLEGTVKNQCKGCFQGKQTRLPFGMGTRRATEKLELIHSDLKGPIDVPTYAGNRYFITFTDDYTRKVWVYMMKKKSETFGVFQIFKRTVETETGLKLKSLRTDNGGEFISWKMKEFLAKEGVKHELTVPYTPEQNGVAERLNRTLLEMARAMILGSEVNKELWGEAVVTAAYLKNRWPSSSLNKNVTPEEAWSGMKPNVEHLRVFGSPCSVHIPDQKRTSFNPKSWSGIFVGYSDVSKAYRVWDPKKKTVIVARDVIIQEGQNFPVEHEEEKKKTSLTIEEIPEEETREEEPDVEVVSPPTLRRSSRVVKPPVRFGSSLSCVGSSNVAELVEPKTLKEALLSPQAKEWQEAVNEELSSLEQHKTWEVCELPAGRKAIGCKWVFKIKQKQDGTVDRFKARLVAKGYSQQEGVDYHETFSPVVSHESLRLLFAFANHQDMEIHQMDVKTAFLNGVLDEEIFMELPEGLQVENDGDKVVRLLKTLYGLKQAPREWNKVLNSFMVEQRMTQHKCDPAVYSRGQGDNQLIVAVYVDDTTIMSKSISEVLSMKTALSGRFWMTYIGEVGTILGIKVIRDRENQTLSLSQEKYVADMLTKFNMQNCAGKRTPMVVGLKLTKDMCPSTEEEVADMHNVPYKEAVGSLMYVMTCTRPDIATAVSCVSAFMHNPGREHWNAVKRIFQYLKYTMNYGLKYTPQDNWEVTGYCDADWGRRYRLSEVYYWLCVYCRRGCDFLVL